MFKSKHWSWLEELCGRKVLLFVDKLLENQECYMARRLSPIPTEFSQVQGGQRSLACFLIEV